MLTIEPWLIVAVLIVLLFGVFWIGVLVGTYRPRKRWHVAKGGRTRNVRGE